jgi:uncharacterized OsmC-like protein
VEGVLALGTNHGPNPQELLLSGVGGCLLVSYAVGATVLGIQLDVLEVALEAELEAELDLRGFLGTEPSVPVALAHIGYRGRLGGDGAREEFARLHKAVARQSPNRMTVPQGVAVEGALEVVESLAACPMA